MDLTGQTYGRLTVLREVPRQDRRIQKMPEWWCQCSCPAQTIKKFTRGNLRKGHSKSCGCLKIEFPTHTIHGKSKDNEFRIEFGTWSGLEKRCFGLKPTALEYDRYQKRGIVVCSGWRNSFQSFLDDMGKRPKDKDSLDRIDNDANYSCGHCEECIEKGWTANCQWATTLEQNGNRSSNRWIEYNGERMILARWAERLSVSPARLSRHIKRNNGDISKSFEYYRNLKDTHYPNPSGKICEPSPPMMYVGLKPVRSIQIRNFGRLF